MAAIIKIDQAGLPAGVAGRARTDGLDDGATVTLESTDVGGTTHTFRLLWVPSGDTNAEASLAVTGNPRIWTFSPTPGAYGTYRIELNVDGEIQIRTFAIRTPNLKIVIPALNEVADEEASLVNNGAPVQAASENNEPYAAAPTINYAGWWPAFEDMVLKLDAEGRVRNVVTNGDSPYAAIPGEFIEVDTTGGDVEIDLPSTVKKGDAVEAKKISADGNVITLDGNGTNIDGNASLGFDIPNEYVRVKKGNTEWREAS